MRALVAGIDLSSMSRRVAERARLMAESSGHSIRLVHVMESVEEAMIPQGQARIMRDYQRASARELADWLMGRTDVEVELVTVNGSPSWTIAHHAKKAPLVVVGSSSIDNFSVGPVSRRVARQSVTDTLVVRRQPRVHYRKVIVGVDFSEHSRVAVEHTLTHFPDADTTLLYSLPARFDPILADAGLFEEEVSASREKRLERASERMEEFAESWNGSLRTLVVDGPPISTIAETLRRRSADLVVVGSRGATATRMVLLGTVAEGLVEEAPCDVLVARVPSTYRRP